MRRADIDVGLGRHPGVPECVRADEALQAVLAGDLRRVAQVLDQLQAEADRQDLRAVDVLDVVGQASPVALERDPVAERVLGRAFGLQDVRAQLGQPAVDLGAALLDLMVDVEAFRHLGPLGELEADDQLLAVRPAVQRIAGRVGPAVLHGLEHCGHFLTDVAGCAAMNQSRDSTHLLVSWFLPGAASAQGQGR